MIGASLSLRSSPIAQNIPYTERCRLAQYTGQRLVRFPASGSRHRIPSRCHPPYSSPAEIDIGYDADHKYGFDAAFGRARRDEEKSRAKERIFSFRSDHHRWDPKLQRPELWSMYNTRKHKGEIDFALLVDGLAALTSPFRAKREMARTLVGDGEFIEIFVDTPLEVAETRDVKGLYRKARRGEFSNFTGIESPESPELVVNTVECSADEAAEKVIAMLQQRS